MTKGGHSSEHHGNHEAIVRLSRVSTVIVIATLFPVIVYGSTVLQVTAIPILSIALVFILLIPMFYGIGRTVAEEPEWMVNTEPAIPSEQLPPSASTSGIAVKGFWQSPARITYNKGSVHVNLSVGKDYSFNLEDVESVRFTRGMNGRVYLNRYGINLRMKNGGTVGIAVSDIEPWRSILTHHCTIEMKSKQA